MLTFKDIEVKLIIALMLLWKIILMTAPVNSRFFFKKFLVIVERAKSRGLKISLKK